MIAINEINTTAAGYLPTQEERETIITFNKTQEPAEVFTYNPALIRKLDELTERRADEVECIRAESINGVQLREYHIPKKWINIRPNRIMTDEERRAWAERFKSKSEPKTAL